MKGIDGGPIISGGRVPLDRYAAKKCRNRDWRVCFIFLMGSDYIVRRVVGLESSGEILRAN